MTPRLLFTAVSGWVLVALLAATIRLPYLLRRRPVPLDDADGAPQAGPADAATRMPREMRGRARWTGPRWRIHFWLGYLIAALAVAHSWASMTRAIARRAHAAGLELATLALLAAIAEVALGLWLRGERDPAARSLARRLHFWAMLTLVILTAVHVALDSSLLGTFRLS